MHHPGYSVWHKLQWTAITASIRVNESLFVKMKNKYIWIDEAYTNTAKKTNVSFLP